MARALYWRSRCSRCTQSCLGWSTNHEEFKCCACHDQLDNSDTRIFIYSWQLQGLLLMLDDLPEHYISEQIERPESPTSVIN